MWVLTVFEKKSFRMFEFTTKAEAVRALLQIPQCSPFLHTLINDDVPSVEKFDEGYL